MSTKVPYGKPKEKKPEYMPTPILTQQKVEVKDIPQIITSLPTTQNTVHSKPYQGMDVNRRTDPPEGVIGVDLTPDRDKLSVGLNTYHLSQQKTEVPIIIARTSKPIEITPDTEVTRSRIIITNQQKTTDLSAWEKAIRVKRKQE